MLSPGRAELASLRVGAEHALLIHFFQTSLLIQYTLCTHRAELASLQAGADRRRRRLLSTCPVVGTTCAALLQGEDMWGSAGVFDVLLLDECSQMTEPTSLTPLLRARARCVAACVRVCVCVCARVYGYLSQL
jgi:hypothetical protein